VRLEGGVSSFTHIHTATRVPRRQSGHFTLSSRQMRDLPLRTSLYPRSAWRGRIAKAPRSP
jgi:hypothetical protein